MNPPSLFDEVVSGETDPKRWTRENKVFITGFPIVSQMGFTSVYVRSPPPSTKLFIPSAADSSLALPVLSLKIMYN